MRIALCDDDPKDLARMKALTQEFVGRGTRPACPNPKIVAFDRPDALLNAAREAPFDLYLLDIVMDHLTGIQLVAELRKFQPDPCVVFFSTSTEYGYDAFQVKAVTYVAKPYTEAQFDAALEDALARIRKEAAQYLVFTKGGEMHRFRAETIEYVSQGDTKNYIGLHLENGTIVETRYSLAAFAIDHAKLVKLVMLSRTLLVNPAQVMNLQGTRVTFFSGRTLDVPYRSLHDLRDAILETTTVSYSFSVHS